MILFQTIELIFANRTPLRFSSKSNSMSELRLTSPRERLNNFHKKYPYNDNLFYQSTDFRKQNTDRFSLIEYDIVTLFEFFIFTIKFIGSKSGDLRANEKTFNENYFSTDQVIFVKKALSLELDQYNERYVIICLYSL